MAEHNRTAFCIFGQVRDEDLSFPRSAEAAIANDAVVFVSVWRSRGTKTLGAAAIPHLCRMFGNEIGFAMPRQVQDDLYGAFPGLDKEINRPGPPMSATEIHAYFPQAIIDIEDENFDLNFDYSNHNDRNSLRMLYRMWRCHRMMRRYEVANGIRFARVVQFRPDLVPPSTLPEPHPRTLHVPGGVRTDFVHDMMACGAPDAVAVVASAFGRAAASRMRPWEGIHKELFDLVTEADLEVLPLEPSQSIMEDFGTRTRINRAILKDALEAGRYNVSILGEEEWHALSNVLLSAIAEAEGTDSNGRCDHLRRSTAAMPPVAREAALAVLSLHQEKRERFQDALAYETYRIVAALQADGLHRLNHFLFEEVVGRLRHLRERNSLGPDDTIATALADWRQSGSLLDETTAVLRPFDDTVAASLIGQIDTHLDRLMYPDVGALSASFWPAFSSSDQWEQAEAIASRIILANPLDFRGFDHMGHYRSRHGDTTAALDYALQAIERERKHWGLWLRAASLYAELGARQEAITYLRAALNCPHGRIVRDYLPSFASSLGPDEVAALGAESQRLHG